MGTCASTGSSGQSARGQSNMARSEVGLLGGNKDGNRILAPTSAPADRTIDIPPIQAKMPHTSGGVPRAVEKQTQLQAMDPMGKPVETNRKASVASTVSNSRSSFSNNSCGVDNRRTSISSTASRPADSSEDLVHDRTAPIGSQVQRNNDYVRLQTGDQEANHSEDEVDVVIERQAHADKPAKMASAGGPERGALGDRDDLAQIQQRRARLRAHTVQNFSEIETARRRQDLQDEKQARDRRRDTQQPSLAADQRQRMAGQFLVNPELVNSNLRPGLNPLPGGGRQKDTPFPTQKRVLKPVRDGRRRHSLVEKSTLPMPAPPRLRIDQQTLGHWGYQVSPRHDTERVSGISTPKVIYTPPDEAHMPQHVISSGLSDHSSPSNISTSSDETPAEELVKPRLGRRYTDPGPRFFFQCRGCGRQFNNELNAVGHFFCPAVLQKRLKHPVDLR